jgi:hypothetical protein
VEGEEASENVTLKLNTKTKNDFTEIIQVAMYFLLTSAKGRETICIRIFKNELNSCFTLKKFSS